MRKAELKMYKSMPSGIGSFVYDVFNSLISEASREFMVSDYSLFTIDYALHLLTYRHIQQFISTHQQGQIDEKGDGGVNMFQNAGGREILNYLRTSLCPPTEGPARTKTDNSKRDPV